MAKYQRKPDGIHYYPSFGRSMLRRGDSLSIYWNKDMLDYLRRHFSTTINEELAECLGVSPRTMIRKARELGLKKDPVWLRAIWDERRKWAHYASRRLGYPGRIKPGQHLSPATEFKPKNITL